MIDRIYLNDGWFFSESFEEEMICKKPPFQDMKAVRLPHTALEIPMNYFDERDLEMVCAYVRTIDIPMAWRQMHLLLTFEGAAHEATVYVNGKKAARHFSGYTAFTVDLRDYLAEGETQQILVRLDSRESLNQPPFGNEIDYLCYGGIYRDVYLDVKPEIYMEDVYVTTPNVLCDEKPLQAMVTLNQMAEGYSIGASLRLWSQFQTMDEDYPENEPDVDDDIDDSDPEEDYADIDDNDLEDEDADLDDIDPYAMDEQIFEDADVRFRTSCLTYTAEDVFNWDLDTPFLYILRLELKKDGQVVDVREVRFGFREVIFDEDGFYLNGEQVTLRGLNRHQSYAYVGYAMPKTPQQLDADLLKFDLGCNVVRTSHYPQSHYFLDRCDEVGLLVVTEIPGWQHIGDEKWKKIAVRNVREMIMQYRNHPSIILWGVRINESADSDAFYYKTNLLAHELDLYRQTGGIRCIKNSRMFEDVYTYNEFVHSGNNEGCEDKCNVTSDMSKAYLVTEHNGHMYPVKMWDPAERRINQALRHAQVIQDAEAKDGISGCIGWCMFDYNTHYNFGSGDGICYHGVMDIFRNPKTAAALYHSQTELEPVLSIAGMLDLGEYDERIINDVYAFTNGESVKAYYNGDFYGEYFPDEERFGAMVHPPVIMSLEAGWKSHEDEWRFEAIRDGQVMNVVTKKPFGKPVIRIMTDRQLLVEEHSYDVATIHIEAVDEHGNHLEFYQEPLALETEGDVELIGPSVVSFRGGYTGTYVRSTGKNGRGVLKVTGSTGTAMVLFETKISKE